MNMISKIQFIAFLTIIVTCSCSNQQYTIIKDVAVFDGEKIHEKVNFIFTDSAIIEITPGKKKYRKGTIIEGAGKTILPPLINAHVHVRAAENLKEAQKVGIFAVLDMFSTDRRANGFRQYNDSLYYAQFYSSNVGATVPGGHGTQFRVRIPTINDSLSARQFIKDRIRENADYIKITQEHTMAKLSSPQLEEIIDETHQNNKKVVAHISDLENALELSKQNIDGLAHIWYREHSIASKADLDLFKEKDLFVIPTLSVIMKVQEQAAAVGRQGKYLSKNDLFREVQKLNRKGLKILAGTDSPNYNMDYSDQYFEELLLLKTAGLSNLEVLKAATTNSYKAFQLEGFESLKKNTVPNFILLDGQPHLRLKDIKAPKRIWKQGKELVS